MVGYKSGPRRTGSQAAEWSTAEKIAARGPPSPPPRRHPTPTTGIFVSCQAERSQIENRNKAMKVLRAKLYELEEDRKRRELEKFYGEKGAIAWGHQIRSYVFMPYQLVKDLRTNAETAQVARVLDGDLDLFIEAWLRWNRARTQGQPTA